MGQWENGGAYPSTPRLPLLEGFYQEELISQHFQFVNMYGEFKKIVKAKGGVGQAFTTVSATVQIPEKGKACNIVIIYMFCFFKF